MLITTLQETEIEVFLPVGIMLIMTLLTGEEDLHGVPRHHGKPRAVTTGDTLSNPAGRQGRRIPSQLQGITSLRRMSQG